MKTSKEVIVAKKRYTTEQIIPKLREAEVELARGKSNDFSNRSWACGIGIAELIDHGTRFRLVHFSD